MMEKNSNLLKKVYNFFALIISMTGFVPKNATIARTIAFISSIIFALYLAIYQPANAPLAIIYFLISEIFYLGFITTTLSENGFRNWFTKRWGDENEGYLAFEGVLGFLFFHNGVSIGYIASSTPGNIHDIIPGEFLLVIVAIMFITGFTIKILAANVVSVEIYYWKDMFLGRKICDFVVTGPYKYLSNPMYGIGQLQAYAMAIWYGSVYGLLAAILNQFLIFMFFYLVEKKFIKRVYQSA
jgi:protein-S-isoprenylcysteine O-methyltransferase Ste14